ncbi:MAG: aminotransferase [Cereibacter sphaeroides]|uniref:Aminotransferase n=1 Tax=Cereibacter sphaeroides TaxID=1063 RepID=A0A2W5TPR9_CERSP|nr:MAG: aminotransferase [Cereibacter sphaeroides]
MHASPEPGFFTAFASDLGGADRIARLREGLIGEGAKIAGPFGEKKLVYADYVASGRALLQVERFMLEQVLPFYANSHTEASYCGERMTRMRREARAIIARSCGAEDERFATIFTGSGATSGLNRLIGLFGVAQAAAGPGAVVFVGPYEHHSNILPWRESGAEVIEIAEAAAGGPDLAMLERALASAPAAALKIGAFSAASNVTGILTEPDTVTRLLKAHGALSVWDYAGGGPYLPIDMRAGTDAEKDAVVISPHKFIGGPGASGVLVLRRAAASRATPTLPGGGTVRFVSPWTHDYSTDVTVREEAGTPNVTGDIRAGLAFLVKQAIGQAFMDQRHEELRQRALRVWAANPNIEVLGNPAANRRLPIFSLRIRDPRQGGHVHQQLFTRMLSDCHGVQARGGCACAGPYAHRLLGIDEAQSARLRSAILSGEEMEKPGWTRLNLSALADDAKADLIIAAVDTLARKPYPMIESYSCDRTTARFRPARAA